MTEPLSKNTNFKPRTENTCIMDSSSFTELQANGKIQNFAIKYVLSGVENYHLNDRDFKVNAGQYLLAGFSGDASVLIDSKNPVKGICIDLSKDLLNEVLCSHLSAGLDQENNDLWHLMSSSGFPENTYFARYTQLGKYLSKLPTKDVITGVNYFEPEPGTYYEIAIALVADCLPQMKVYNRIKSIKISTQKELFRKLMNAKGFIDNTLPVSIEIREIAQEHGFSEYHFFRLFKTAFQISPYQYLINKRMQLATHLLNQNNSSVSEVAFACGFADLHSFSKAFKKKFGHPPSHFGRLSK